MKIEILGFITETSIDTMTFARKAESLGFDTFYLPEHPIIPVVRKSAYPASADGVMPKGSHTSILSVAWRRRRPGLPMADWLSVAGHLCAQLCSWFCICLGRGVVVVSLYR
jgi:alkanesulfonate monooxygenase SsuD/methylene tetrahydromethanopterin reductase-like flavin-dependent oxidoreductase (luciferase family)